MDAQIKALTGIQHKLHEGSRRTDALLYLEFSVVVHRVRTCSSQRVLLY